jgi:hypothetical protein
MHGSGRSQGLLVHLLVGAALGAVIVLVVWIFSGGRPFGEVVGTTDVSNETPAAVVGPAAPAPPADAASRLSARPPELAGNAAAASELRFRKEQAERKVAARRPKRAAHRRKARRGPVVRVVAPPAEQQAEQAPVATVPSPSPAPSATPQPAAPPPRGAGGGGTAKPKPSGPTLWAGEG